MISQATRNSTALRARTTSAMLATRTQKKSQSSDPRPAFAGSHAAGSRSRTPHRPRRGRRWAAGRNRSGDRTRWRTMRRLTCSREGRTVSQRASGAPRMVMPRPIRLATVAPAAPSAWDRAAAAAQARAQNPTSTRSAGGSRTAESIHTPPDAADRGAAARSTAPAPARSASRVCCPSTGPRNWAMRRP